MSAGGVTTASKGTRRGEEELVFLALGGLGEVGMNCYLYGLGRPAARRWLMVDLGITFPEGEDDPGVDVILPDLKFIEEHRRDLAGLLLTHAHEDHVGAVLELWSRLQVPIYATPFTATFLKAKMSEYGNKQKIPITEVPMRGKFAIGPFECELVTMAHSIPEPSGVVLTTPFGRVFHTGDWKLDATPVIGDPADTTRLAALGEEGVLALVCDSTNAFRDGRSPSERDVAASLTRIIKRAKRRVLVTAFASNVARIHAVAEAAAASGRQLVVAGRAMHRVIQVAIDTGYLPPDFRWSDQKEFSHLAPHQVLALVTGSQGEPRAALARIAEDQHPAISLASGDMVIFSSRTIPGNEKPVGRIQNALARMGCEVVTDTEALVHVTGHPRREELRQLYGWIKPEVAVPMHGEVRHLKEHGRIARESGVNQVVTAVNGEIVRLAPGRAQIVDEAPAGRLFRDGSMIIPSDSPSVRQRRRLAFAGIALVSLVLSQQGRVLADPEVHLDGIPDVDDKGGPMTEIALDAVEGTLRGIPPARRKDTNLVAEAIRRSVRSALEQVWGKKTIVKVMIAVVDPRER